MAAKTSQSRPLLAIGYGPRCISLVELTRVAGALCDVAWLIDESIPEMTEMSGFLKRFGSVIDIGGLSVKEIVHALSSPRAPDGIVTFLDKNMVTLAGVAELLELPFHTVDTARALTDKASQRECLAEKGLISARCHVLSAEEIARGQVAPETDLGWPAVLKPRSSQGSYYTFLVEGADHLDSLLRLIGSDCPEMILESYIPDDPQRGGSSYASYVSVESVVAHGEVHHLAVTGRFPLAANFRETGFFLPAALSNRDRTDALDLASAAIAALGVHTGSLHTEIKFTSEGPRVVEVNGRMGGGVFEMLSRAADIDLLEITLRVALGESVDIQGPVDSPRIGYRFFLQPPPVSAIVSAIDGLDLLSDYPGVDTISIHQRPGDQLNWRDGSRNHILSVVGSASTYDQLQEVSRIVNEVVKVSYIDIHRD